MDMSDSLPSNESGQIFIKKKTISSLKLNERERKYFDLIIKSRIKIKAIRSWKCINVLFIVVSTSIFLLVSLLRYVSDYYGERTLSDVMINELICNFINSSSVAIVLSAYVAVNSALITLILNRNMEVKKNTVDALNNLDMDEKYWKDASDILSIIKSARKRCECSDENPCSCPIFLDKNDLDRVDYRNVLRRFEWLCEGVIRGFYDRSIICQRKGHLMFLIYCSCSEIVLERMNEHFNIYNSINKYQLNASMNDNSLKKEELRYTYLFLRSYMHEHMLNPKSKLEKFSFPEKILGLTD